MKITKKIVIANFDAHRVATTIGMVVAEEFQYLRDISEKQGKTPKRITIKIKIEDEIGDSGVKNAFWIN